MTTRCKRRVAQMTLLKIRVLTLGAVPKVAPMAVTSSMINNCNGGAAGNPRFCQAPSLIPNATNARAIPVQTRLTMSSLLQEGFQLTIMAPSVVNGTNPSKIAMNPALGGRNDPGAAGGRFARNR